MTSPEQGWYADPEHADRLRWWDGTSWTPHTHDRVPAQLLKVRPPLGPGWPRLAIALQVALALTIPISVFVYLADRTILDVWQRLASDPTSVEMAEAYRADDLGRLSLAELPLLLITGVLFVCWLYQAHRSDRMDPAFHKRGSGWAIGGWFTPVVNLWFPFQAVSDLRDSARSDARPPSYALQWFWWIGFLCYAAASRGAAQSYLRAGTIPEDDVAAYADKLQEAVLFEQIAEVLSVVTAVLAIVMVRQITAWVRRAPVLTPGNASMARAASD